MERIEPLLFWPMNAAERASKKAAKLALIIVYFLWCVAMIPLILPCLFISIGQDVWESVNENENDDYGDDDDEDGR